MRSNAFLGCMKSSNASNDIHKIQSNAIKQCWFRQDHNNNTVWKRRYVDQNTSETIKETIIDIDEHCDEGDYETDLNTAQKQNSGCCCCHKCGMDKVVDVVSRVLFPVSFGCFNIGYWLVQIAKDRIWL